jgi:hypothetical protein
MARLSRPRNRLLLQKRAFKAEAGIVKGFFLG